MRQVWMIGIGLWLTGFSAASAQSIIPPPNLTAPPPAQSSDRALPDAPIGHRQPRVGDFPAAQDNRQVQEDDNARQDAVLDRRIKGICRGC